METQEILQGIHDWTNGKIVYDISVAHPDGQGNPTPYADLAAALGTGGANIPEGLRKGGMSVKFVQSSDNKYVQYRLMSDSWSINTNDWSFCGDSVYVENPEWIYILLDAEERILAGLKSDGSVEWSIGVPTPVKTYIDNNIAEIKNGTEGTDIDGINKIIAFLSEFSTSDTLKDLLDTKVDKEEGKSLIDADYASSQSIIDNPEYLQLTIDSEDNILEGKRIDGTNYFNKIESPTITGLQEQIEILSNRIASIEGFPCIPYTGYGRMIISDIIDTYCHAPQIVARDNDVYVLYHASSTKNHEDPQANIDRYVLKCFKDTHPYNTFRLVVVDATNPFYYNNKPAKIIYNGNVNLLKDNTTLFVKFSCQIEDGDPQLFGIKYNRDSIYKKNNYFPLKLKYISSGEEITVDYTKSNYFAMINATYGSGLVFNGGVAFEYQETILYNNKYYKIETAGDGTSPRPMVLMSSDDCVTWSPVLNIVDTVCYNEVSFKIVNDVIYILGRFNAVGGGGVNYFTCSLDGSNISEPITLSTEESKPNTFILEDKVFGIYTIPTPELPNSIRTKLQVAELKSDNTVGLIQTITNYEQNGYPYVCNHKGHNLLFACVEQSGHIAHQNLISYSHLKLEL